MASLRVGLVGPGRIGQTHARAIDATEGVDLVAIAGGFPEEVAALRSARPELSTFSTLEAMIEAGGIDIVAICNPSGAHAQAARTAMQAGLHVLVEKPLCVNPDEGANLVGLAEQCKRVCGVVSQRRLEPQHQAIHALLRSGQLGTPRLIEGAIHWWRSDEFYRECDWRSTNEHGGGSLFNQGVHTLDLMLWLLGPVISVQSDCATLGHALAIEDTTASVLRFASGPLGTLVTSTALPPGQPAMLRLFTDKGGFELAHDQIVRWDFADVEKPDAVGAGGSAASNPGAIGIVGHVAQWEDFVAAIRDHRSPAVTIRDGFEVVRTGAAIYRSARERRAVSPSEFKLPGETP